MSDTDSLKQEDRIFTEEQVRGGKQLPLKSIVDEAIAMGGCATLRNVVIYKRTGANINVVAGRDFCLDDVLANQASTCEPEWVDAEHPLFILYTSGSTGKPKGVQHASGNPGAIETGAINRGTTDYMRAIQCI
jgi:acetyl-CoA synthetase